MAERVCKWTLDRDCYYWTDCDNLTQTDGTLTDNKMVFCTYCGGRIEEHHWSETAPPEAFHPLTEDDAQFGVGADAVPCEHREQWLGLDNVRYCKACKEKVGVGDY